MYFALCGRSGCWETIPRVEIIDDYLGARITGQHTCVGRNRVAVITDVDVEEDILDAMSVIGATVLNTVTKGEVSSMTGIGRSGDTPAVDSLNGMFVGDGVFLVVLTSNGGGDGVLATTAARHRTFEHLPIADSITAFHTVFDS